MLDIGPEGQAVDQIVKNLGSDGYEYHDTILERLFDTAPTKTKAEQALATLAIIIRHLC